MTHLSGAITGKLRFPEKRNRWSNDGSTTMRNTSTVPIVERRKTMMGTVSVLVDELDSDEFIVGDLEASDSELPVAVTDQETAAVEFHSSVSTLKVPL